MSRLDVADMHAQMAERAERLATAGPRPPAACSRSSPATAWPSCSARSGAVPLDGGPTLNPSTYELLAGIHGVPAEEVVVLPNSPNVIMAAERAAELSEKSVRVVRSRSQQAGLAAAVALDPFRSAAANAEAMERGAGPRAHRRRHRGGARRQARRASAAARRSASSTSSSSPGASRRGDARGRARRARRDAELVTLIAGDGAPLDSRGAVAAGARTGSSSSTPTAASPATGG